MESESSVPLNETQTHDLVSYLFKIYFNIIRPSAPGSWKWYFKFWFQTEIP
jgi:hypothetical protein